MHARVWHGHLYEPDIFLFFFFNDTATTEIYTLSLHDALPICSEGNGHSCNSKPQSRHCCGSQRDRKSTRLNSSHGSISYAVFCLKKTKILAAVAILERASARRSSHDWTSRRRAQTGARWGGGFGCLRVEVGVCVFLFFFLMIARPQNPPLFPPRPLFL